MRVNYKVPFEIKKKIETELYQYWDNIEELKELQQDILDESANPPDGQPRGKNMVSNPTEQKAIKLRTTRSIVATERKLRYIEKAIARLNEEEQQIFNVIFRDRYSQKQAETCRYISKDSYYNTYNKIIFYTAVEFGEI